MERIGKKENVKGGYFQKEQSHTVRFVQKNFASGP